MIPWTIIRSNMSRTNTSGSNYENGPDQVQTELCDEKGVEEWKNILDENLEQVLKFFWNFDEGQVPAPAPDSTQDVKTCQEDEDLKKCWYNEAARILINFLPEQLKSSQYFYYANLKDELEVAEELLKTIFSTQHDFALQSHFVELSRMIQDKNDENQKRHEKIKHELNEAYSLMRETESVNWKEMAEKYAPEPIQWTEKTTQELQDRYFGSVLKSIGQIETETTAKVPVDLDFRFKTKCHSSSWKKTNSIYEATHDTLSLIREYARVMKEQLEKIVFFPSEADFLFVHETALVNSFNTAYLLWPAKHFETAWSRLDDDLKSAVLVYKQKFWMKNLRIRQQQEETVEQIVDFALEKYNKFVHEAKIKCGGSDYESKIFIASQVSTCNDNTYTVIKDCFTKNPCFKFSLTEEKAWTKVNEQLWKLWQEDLEKNQRKYRRMKFLQKYVMVIAENVYQKLMECFLCHFSLSQDQLNSEEYLLEDFHLEAVIRAQDFYVQKLEKFHQFYHYQGISYDFGVHEDKDRDKEALKAKCTEMKQQIVREHKEKVAKEKEEKKQQQEKQQQSPNQNINISNISVQNSSFNSNNTQSNLEGAVTGARPKTGADSTDRNNITGSEEILQSRNRTKKELELLVNQLKSQLEQAQNELSSIGDENEIKLDLEGDGGITEVLE